MRIRPTPIPRHRLHDALALRVGHEPGSRLPVCPFARLPVSTRPWPTCPSAQPGDASESSHGYLAVSNKTEPRDLRLVGQARDALPSVGSTSALAQDQLLLRFNLCTDQTPPGFGVRPSLSSATVSAVYSSARGPSIRV
ncbi:hypothetical protein BGZ61DRAFT_472330 [Ilyonectria robusta]|uniref:uncharacterized protein n=1 Tax=Ilyonectria robusta TaxID=1079257 RepID=UPI001E8CB272|nr:uncharacterized protein BGZ61DRAFT_472330 [Ilyonectria robusta]KAH8735952.1 hypothetical protein BGZ61DRAFT_472330 [Ilyonectria robusta]